ncbi:MAG TPA: AraC family transcriptional regulator [Candidatus Wallbacteria bacterium]|nr:AraC family transcriptional regulator [Candidatus Wallbacteria bacterium]
MDYFEMIQRVLDYIEMNLNDKVSLERISEAACFSPYHFHRIFKAMAGESVGEYMRRRRLSEASKKLLETSERIIDIALEFQFESQESFTRAFKKVFKTTPGRYRSTGRALVEFERAKLNVNFLKNVKGVKAMEPKIVVKKEFKVVGMRGQTCLKNNVIPKMWENFFPRMGEIINRINKDTAYGICECSDIGETQFNDETLFNELVCVEVDRFDAIPKAMVCKTIPEQKYAVFTHRGPLYNLRQTYDYIYKTWIPTSGYQMAFKDDFELYDGRFKGIDDPGSEFDIYVPIK